MTSISHVPPRKAPTFTVRSVEDLLAVVPLVLGFEPTESLVLLTFGSREAFHGRVDLPPPEHAEEVVEMLVDAARRQRPRTAAVLCYSGDERTSGVVGCRLAAYLRREGVEVIDEIRAHEGRWFRLRHPPGPPEPGVPYDASTHRFRVESVYAGQVVHGSREELRDTLRADPTQQRVIDDLVDGLAGGADVDPPGCSAARAALLVDQHLPQGRFPDEVLGELLVALGDVSVRDAAWVGISRQSAKAHVALWTDAVRRAPDRLGSAPAAVLALAAWVAGNGALAWCAVDRCQALEPANTLAALVADLLSQAVSPSVWEKVADDLRTVL